jgi:hypothetical protein|nr:hypothetical protein [Aeromicrobium sp.]
MFPFGDAQPPRITPSDNSARLTRSTEHRRESSERPLQYRPRQSRLRRMVARITSR